MSHANNLAHITAADAEHDPAPLDFTPRRSLAAVTRITCVVCNASVIVPIASTRLCHLCRKDPSATARHITDRLQAADMHFKETADRFDADYAHSDHQARFQKMLNAEDSFPPAVFAARIKMTIDIGDDFAALVTSWQAMRDAQTAYRSVCDWATAAQEEMEGL